MSLKKYRIYLIGAALFALGILVGYFLNPKKYEDMTAQQWYTRYREVAFSRAQIVDCIHNSFFESDQSRTLEEVKKCTALINVVPVDLNSLQ